MRGIAATCPPAAPWIEHLSIGGGIAVAVIAICIACIAVTFIMKMF